MIVIQSSTFNTVTSVYDMINSASTTQSTALATFNKYMFANIIIAVFGILSMPFMLAFVITLQCVLGLGCAKNKSKTGQVPFGSTTAYGNSMNTMNTMNTMPMNQPYMMTTTTTGLP